MFNFRFFHLVAVSIRFFIQALVQLNLVIIAINRRASLADYLGLECALLRLLQHPDMLHLRLVHLALLSVLVQAIK